MLSSRYLYGIAWSLASADPVRAYESSDGVTISLPEAKNDKARLSDRNDCSHIWLSRAVVTTNLSEEQIAELL